MGLGHPLVSVGAAACELRHQSSRWVYLGLAPGTTLHVPCRDFQPDQGLFARVVSLEGPALDLPVLQIAEDRTVLVRFDGIGRFRLRGKRVTCQLETAPDAPVISAVVFGNVLASLCWQRGQLPLHGSAVAIDGRALLLLGRAATGKSTLAAALALRGHAVLSDEVAVIVDQACLPAGGALSLADDALALLGIDGDDLPRYENFSLAKRLWLGGATVEPRSYPLAAIVCLGKAEADVESTLTTLDGEAAIAALLNQMFWRGMLKVGDTEARVLTRDPDVRCLQDLGAAGDRRTLDGRDQRLGQPEALEQRLDHRRVELAGLEPVRR